MPINFPDNPLDDEVYVAAGNRYIYDATKGYWKALSTNDTVSNLSLSGSLTASGLSYPTSDGTNGQALVTDGAGNLSFTTITSGGTPGGADTQIQFNSAGAFAGSANLTFDGSTLVSSNIDTGTLDLTNNGTPVVTMQVAGDTTDSSLVISNYQGGVLSNAISVDSNGQLTAASFSGSGANLTGIQYTVTQSDVTQHQGALSITESQISDLQNYLTAETNDLTQAVVWANVPDANITQSSVIQHQAALSITESQISDLQSYLTAEADTIDTVTGRGSITLNDVGFGNIAGVEIVAGASLFTPYAQFPNNIANPPYQEGRLFYDQTAKALAYYNDEADVTLQIGQEQWIRVYNNTGSTINNGQPVYLSGETLGVPTIALADAATEINATAVGLATHNIENATFGYVTTRGLVQDIDTSALTAGQRVHVSPTAGVLQTTSPTYPYYSTDIGICLISNATTGCIYVDVQQQHSESFRTSGNASFDGDVRIGGDLTILGTQSTIQVSTIRVDDNIIYLNGGNAIAPEDITFTGTGLDDLIFNGYYEGNDAGTTYYVRIDGVGTGTGGVDTFEWSVDNFSTTEATGIDITGDNQLLNKNIKVNFNAATGHTLNDTWEATATPSNVDIGFMGNRNTGATGGGYDHVGFFFDTADSKFKAFSSYGPDPIGGNINASDPSFVLGDIEAGTFTGNLTGNVTGNVTGNASTATALASGRTFTLTGDVTGTGNAAFDGTDNITIATTLSATYLTDITGETIGSLSDVSVAGATDGQVLTYNNTSGNWEAQDATGGTGGGSFQPIKLDPITTVNNQSDYTMQVSGVNHDPASDFALLVSLNGVIQEPGVGFNTLGSTITFIPALQTGDVVDFIVDLGNAVDVTEVVSTDTLDDVTTRGASTANTITAGGYAVAAGTSSEFLKADGSTDNTAYYSSGSNITAGSLTVNGEIIEQAVNTTNVSGTTALDPANGTIQRLVLSANVTFTDSLANGESVTLQIDDGAGNTITWPTTLWVGGSAPTLDTANDTVIQLWKVNSTLYGALVGVAS